MRNGVAGLPVVIRFKGNGIFHQEKIVIILFVFAGTQIITAQGIEACEFRVEHPRWQSALWVLIGSEHGFPLRSMAGFQHVAVIGKTNRVRAVSTPLPKIDKDTLFAQLLEFRSRANILPPHK